ncbi:MAG: hypothetical protein N4A49_01745 [Marinifilaceae bacterium]|jgi:hypothetical protein|nr:hypothetical protein [Marinifilaceae bacterium]
MARTTQEIQSVIESEVKKNMPELSSESKFAIWRLWSFIIASTINLFEQIIDSTKDYLQNYIDNRRYGRLEWYIKLAYDFKLGYRYKFNTETGKLDYIKYKDYSADTDLKIIKRVSITENDEDSSLTIKVATQDKNGNLIKLSDEMLLQFKNYLNDAKVAGTRLNVKSLNSDKIIIGGNVYYDGSYALDAVKDNIRKSLDLFKNEFDFTGQIVKNEIISCIRNTVGVEDFQLIDLKANHGGGEKTIERTYVVASGYFNFYDNELSDKNVVESFNYITNESMD